MRTVWPLKAIASRVEDAVHSKAISMVRVSLLSVTSVRGAVHGTSCAC